VPKTPAVRSRRSHPPGAWRNVQPSIAFQIETPGLAPTLENDPQESIYFARDLLTDRFGRFFSCPVSDSSSIGRK
jgi:hypothetical protein